MLALYCQAFSMESSSYPYPYKHLIHFCFQLESSLLYHCSFLLGPPLLWLIVYLLVFLNGFHEVMGPNAMILVFWMLSFKPTFSLSSFTFIKRLFSSSSLSAIRVVSSAYLRLLILLPANLTPACASSNLVFLIMYSEEKLNKQGDNMQPWCTLFSRTARRS